MISFLYFSGFVGIAEKTDMLWQVFSQGTFSWQSGEYNFCLVITTPAVEKYLHVIKIVSIGSHTECVAEVCMLSLPYFVSLCVCSAQSEMSVCSDHMRKSWCPRGCEERPMSHSLWKERRHICEVPSCLLLTTTVNAVSSVKKGLVKIDDLTCAIFVCLLWITLPAEHFSADYRWWKNINYICTFHALHFSGLWTLIIMTSNM